MPACLLPPVPLVGLLLHRLVSRASSLRLVGKGLDGGLPGSADLPVPNRELDTLEGGLPDLLRLVVDELEVEALLVVTVWLLRGGERWRIDRTWALRTRKARPAEIAAREDALIEVGGLAHGVLGAGPGEIGAR